MPSLACFHNCWALCNIGRNTEETLSLRYHAEESFREWLRLILKRIAAFKKFYTKPDQQFCWQSNSTRDYFRTWNVPRSLPILCWYTLYHKITLFRPLQRKILILARKPRIMISQRGLWLPVNMHAEAVICSDRTESMIILLCCSWQAAICPRRHAAITKMCHGDVRRLSKKTLADIPGMEIK